MRLEKAVKHTCIQLTVKWAEEFRVPWPGGFFTDGIPLALACLAGVDEVVRVAVA